MEEDWTHQEILQIGSDDEPPGSQNPKKRSEWTDSTVCIST